MKKTRFEWDGEKDGENQRKQGVSFALAQRAFLDPHRVIAEDTAHSGIEERLYCIGRIEDGIMTVRFTYRRSVKKSRFSFPPETHPLTPSLSYRGGTIRLAMSYLLSSIERRPRGEFRRSGNFTQ
ncbi:MAG: BrnT family toxin [Candidatus Latescibacterota bacterium]